MKKLLSLALAAAFTTLTALAGDGSWGTDPDKGVAEAKGTNKLVLLDFTGSDWCGWCIKLNKEVFMQPEFQQYAKENLVLVELDFPRRKPQDVATKARNEALAAKYGVRGFPTIIVLNGEGKKVGELGYVKGGPSAFLAELKKIKS
ncbi:MAG: thioredoxin family protein [Verrucomicrobia bacterium]|nr:thioredoxin family protein [Verrucomicrobiota bacterium]